MQGHPLMLLAAWPDWFIGLLNWIIILIGVFLILLVLIQRGKGGGLAGAFGGVGGSSAFGSRAGDQFTRVTLITAAVWVLVIMFMAKIIAPPLPEPPGPPEVRPTETQSKLWHPASDLSGHHC